MTKSTRTRREFLKQGGAAAAAVAVGAMGGAFGASPGKRPNILLVMTDQQHIDTISAGGCPYVRTPAMDRLVKRGVSFLESHSTNPVCSPARSSLMTGRMPCETGVHVNGRPIREGVPNLGQLLGNAGYDTVYAGKWHMPRSATYDIPGFRVIASGIGGQGNLGDAAASRACQAYLENASGAKPFFMVASFLQPHDICQWLRINKMAPPKLRYPEIRDELPPLPKNFGFDAREPGWIARRRSSNEASKGDWGEEQWRYYLWSYYRHIEMVDAEIGRVLDALDASGRADDTVVIFTADHGEGTAHHQMTRKNNGYEAALKVPLVVAWPGEGDKGRTDRTHLVSGLDVAATIMDCAGVTPPAEVQGRSLRPLVAGKRVEWHDAVVAELIGNKGRVIRTPQYKYIAYQGDPVDQLFDMQADRGEMRNLSGDAAHADAVRAMRARLRDWERSLMPAPKVPLVKEWRELTV